MAGVSWITSSLLAQNGSEKLLRMTHLFPKLKSNHGERKADVFRTSEPVPSALAHPKEWATLPPAPLPALANPKVAIVDAPGLLPTPEPPRVAINELTPVSKVDGPTPIEMCLDPVVYLEPCAPKRGDTPMIRNWKMLTMLSLLSAATVQLTPPPMFAGEKQEPNGDLKKSIDKLIKQIDALEKKPVDRDAIAEVLRAELKKLENGTLAEIRTDIGGIYNEQRKQKKELEEQRVLINLLTGRLDGLERKLAAGSPGAPAPAVDKAFMDELRSMLKTFTDSVAKMAPSQSHVAMSPPTNGATGQARVMLVNHYPEMLLFEINGIGYRLEGRSSKVIDVPAGTLTYQVFSNRYGTLEMRSTKIASGNTFNLSAQ
jgi:hypothetical protein